ncbi:helix-turn-helix transcriptional regulator [Bacillus sp. A116_S68]|nr:helix-turn-helix transcriptional regulator [Bacillus sp. A116_S68]
MKLVMTMSSFGKQLKRLRLQHELKQEDLAAKLNISKSAVSMYERDEREPSFQLVKELARFFDVSTDDLLGHHDSKQEHENTVLSLEQLSDDEVEYLKESLEIYRKMKRNDWKRHTNK